MAELEFADSPAIVFVGSRIVLDADVQQIFEIEFDPVGKSLGIEEVCRRRVIAACRRTVSRWYSIDLSALLRKLTEPDSDIEKQALRPGKLVVGKKRIKRS